MSFLMPLMTVLAAIAVVVIMIVGLVSVPWPVLLLLLVAGLIAAQRALAAIPTAEIQPVPASSPIEPIMDQLTEQTAAAPRVNPDATITAAMETKGKCLKYRGAEVRPIPTGPILEELALKQAIAIPANPDPVAPEAALDTKGKCLQYRGAVYECPEGTTDQPDCCEIEVAGIYRGVPSTVHLRGKGLLPEHQPSAIG